MPDARQLNLLSGLAHERGEVAAKRLGRSLALLRESESRLALLQSYFADYRGRLARNAAHGVSADEMRNFREFIRKLEQAIGQQRAEVEALERAVVENRRGWMHARREGRSFEVLSERAESLAREAESRRLQKIVDEFAGRAAALRVAG